MSASRILTTHAGSLPRDARLQPLLTALARHERVAPDELEAAVAQATVSVVDQQLRVGLDVINDGEQGRESFFTYVQHRMTGFGGQSSRPMMADRTYFQGLAEQSTAQATSAARVNLMSAPQARSEVRYTDAGRAAVRGECERFAQVLESRSGFEAAFMTAPSPGIIAAAMENAHYATLEEYVDALARALENEYQAIIDAGFHLQIDAPDLAMERHTLFQDRPLDDFIEFARTVIAAINRAVAHIDRERVRLHVCWGNYEGPHIFDVALHDIWPTLSGAHAGAYLISMANPRHAHEWRHFEANPLPADARMIAGVIDTTTNYVEHPQAVADRIERVAAALGDPSRVMAGTDCGFETAAGFRSVAPDVAWAKLEALCEGAALASQRLF